MKYLLSPPNIHIVKITLRENTKPIFLHLIKVLKIIQIIDRAQGKTPLWIYKFFIGTYSNEVLTITSEHPSSEDHFETKFQDNISPYNQIFEQAE